MVSESIFFSLFSAYLPRNRSFMLIINLFKLSFVLQCITKGYFVRLSTFNHQPWAPPPNYDFAHARSGLRAELKLTSRMNQPCYAMIVIRKHYNYALQFRALLLATVSHVICSIKRSSQLSNFLCHCNSILQVIAHHPIKLYNLLAHLVLLIPYLTYYPIHLYLCSLQCLLAQQNRIV